MNLKNRFPFWYFEHCSVYRKDNNLILKSENHEIEIPYDNVGMILLGPGVNISSNSISHAIKHKTQISISTSNQVPSAILSTKGYHGSGEWAYQQAITSINKNKKMIKAKYLTELRFPHLKNEIMLAKNIRTVQGIEGAEVRKIYQKVFGQSFKRTHTDEDPMNYRINIANNALYNLLMIVCIEYGLSPHLAFIHGKRRNGFIYDLADVFKTVEYYTLIKKSKDIKTCLKNLSNYLYNKDFFDTIEGVLKNVFDNTKVEQSTDIWSQGSSIGDYLQEFEEY